MNALYPNLGITVARLRHAEPYDRKAHGEAVEKAIRSLQRAELNRQTKTPTRRDEPIGKARRKWLAGKLLAYPAQIRRARTPCEWQQMYNEAMMEKRK